VGTFHEDLHVFPCTALVWLDKYLSEWKMFQTKLVGNSGIHTLWPMHFFCKSYGILNKWKGVNTRFVASCVHFLTYIYSQDNNFWKFLCMCSILCFEIPYVNSFVWCFKWRRKFNSCSISHSSVIILYHPNTFTSLVNATLFTISP
jgi:hypothetical protein